MAVSALERRGVKIRRGNNVDRIPIRDLPYPDDWDSEAPWHYVEWCEWAYRVNVNSAYLAYIRHPEWGEWPGKNNIPFRTWCRISTT